MKEMNLEDGYYWVLCQKNHEPKSKNRCLCSNKPIIMYFNSDCYDKHGGFTPWDCETESSYKVLKAIPPYIDAADKKET